MEKLVLKRITLILISIFIFIFLASSLNIFIIKNKSVKKDLTEMISQIENSYKENALNIEATKELFKDDYLNRAYAIDYILNNNKEENLNNEALKRIKKLMEVESVHIVDKNGVITLSSSDESIGINLLNNKESYPFWNLIKGQDTDGEVVQLDAKSISKKEEKIYIGVKSTLEEYSLIQIGLDKSAFDNLVKAYSIEHIVNSTPTVYEKALFVVDKDTGEVLSVTKNNEQGLVIDDANSNEEFRDKLYELTDGNIIKINNKYRYVKSKIVDNYIIAGYVDIDRVYRKNILDIIYLILIMILALLSVITIVKFSLKKYILKDLYNIEDNIKNLITGNDNDIEFNIKYDTELKEISNALNLWKESYKYKTERMTRIMSAINTHSSIFECLYLVNKNFFSDNIKEILGVDDNTWSSISNTPERFENYINSIGAKEGIVNINNRFLKIISFKKEYEFYGMIIDKTDDEEVKSKFKKESETDSLTRLLNRNGLTNRIENIFEESNNGVLIIFDLDNFKNVNDELGHPIGDEVLKVFSNCLVNSFRKNDIISRIGGDEFIVFINKNIELDNLSNKLNKILYKVRKDLNEYYEKYGLSTSVGVAYKNERNNTYEKLYKVADESLYKAKKLGKNRFYINKE